MKDSERLGLVALIVNKLRQSKSWTGRMHIQKLTYMAQEVGGLPQVYDFVLYQRGPYSFGLDEDIRSARAIGALDISIQPFPYGPSYIATSSGESLASVARVSDKTLRDLTDLAQVLGPRQARDLELLATTLYVMREGYESEEQIVGRVLSLKPQFDRSQVQQALRDIESLVKRLERG